MYVTFHYRRQTYRTAISSDGWFTVHAVYDNGTCSGSGGHSDAVYRVDAARAQAASKPRGLIAAALAALGT